MENIVAITTQILQLSETIQEGIEHLLSRMDEGYFEDNYYLFQDMVSAFSAIYEAVKSIAMLPPLKESQIMDLSVKLFGSLNGINDSYENHEQDKAKLDMQMVLLPALSRWKEELERFLHPLVDS